MFAFADEMRVGLRGTVRKVWGCRGVKVVQRVQLAYRWMYLFLVVDGRRGKLSWTWIDSMKCEAIASAVGTMRRRSDVEALVWDGARGHHGEKVEDVGVPTIVQPAYSPELNPVERVFEEVRRLGRGQTIPEHRGEDGGGQSVLARPGIRPGPGTLTCRVGLDRRQRASSISTLNGPLTVNRYKTVSTRRKQRFR